MAENEVIRDSVTPPVLPVFVNATAGRDGTGTAARLAHALRAARVAADIVEVPPSGLAHAVAAGVAAGVPRLGVAGGDGSLRTAAALLAGSRTVLVPFPSGTLNRFARRHGLETLERAAAAAAANEPRRVSLGVLDDELFLNTTTIGYYADVVRRRERLRPWLSKWPAAAVAFLTLALRWPRLSVELEMGDEQIRRTTSLVWIGVGWGSFPHTHQAVDRRGAPDLEVAILRADSRRALFGLLLRLLPQLVRSDPPISDPALELYHTRSLIIRAPHGVNVTMDGERFRLQPPLYIGVQDLALRIARCPARPAGD
jgi:diacylglycerol kinase family enzyme